ncbi:MAG: periplasmic binding domain protein [Actinomycetia bacterium]|nr:periplasmic binding domain protein [Actinomycetes bacterium]
MNQRLIRRLRNRVLVAGLVIVAVAGIVVAATSPAVATPGSSSQDKVKITLIIPELANPFYVPGEKGARSAAKKYGVDLQIVGTQQFDVHQQIALFDDALTAGTQAIVAVPGDPTTLNNAIAKAKAQGVRVGTVFLDAPKSTRDFFVGHDVVREGREQGQRVLQVLHRRSASGVVPAVITTCAPGSTGQEGRRAGFTQAVTQQNPYLSTFQVKIVAYLNATGEPATSLANHQNLLLAHPDVKVMYPMCAINTLSAGQVVKAANRKDIIIAGHDWLPQTLDLIQQGWIPWSVGEAPYDNCFKAVKWLAQAVRGTKPVPHGLFITKTILATNANLAEIRKSPNASG